MPKLLEQVRSVIRFRRYSHKTEVTYVYWVKQYIYFNNVRRPVEMGGAEVTAFLAHLARELHISASTQNQALSALLFLYRDVPVFRLFSE